jgi:hypothetical protein
MSSSNSLRRGLAAITLVAGSLGLAACSDAPIEPRPVDAAPSLALPRPASLSAKVSIGNGIDVLSSSTTNGVTTSRIKIDPRVNVSFGDASSMVNIPANSICDPGKSGYGPAFWDAPCAAAKNMLTFTVKSWTDANGRSRVEFTPDVRFAPGKMVGLYIKDATALDAANAAIKWCLNGNQGCVDESLTDASLATQRDRTSGYLFRRVKHFSGYMVSVGLTDDGSDGSSVIGIQ